MHPFVYLASQSPRRRQLLEQIGVDHRLLVAQDDDPEPEDPEALELVLPRESATDYVQRVTGLKLDAALARLQRRGLEQAQQSWLPPLPAWRRQQWRWPLLQVPLQRTYPCRAARRAGIRIRDR